MASICDCEGARSCGARVRPRRDLSEELASRLRGTRVTANAVHPGIVRTHMMLNAPGAFRVVSYLALPFSTSAEKAAKTTIHVASSPELATVSGRYFTASKPVSTKNRFDTKENRALLWDMSIEALHLNGADVAVRRAS